MYLLRYATTSLLLLTLSIGWKLSCPDSPTTIFSLPSPYTQLYQLCALQAKSLFLPTLGCSCGQDGEPYCVPVDRFDMALRRDYPGLVELCISTCHCLPPYEPPPGSQGQGQGERQSESSEEDTPLMGLDDYLTAQEHLITRQALQNIRYRKSMPAYPRRRNDGKPNGPGMRAHRSLESCSSDSPIPRGGLSRLKIGGLMRASCLDPSARLRKR